MQAATSRLNLDYTAYNDHFIICGFGDSGKTYYFKKVLLPWFVNAGTVVAIYDYNGIYDDVGLPITSRFDYLAQFLLKRKSIIFQSVTNSDDDFKKFCLICSKLRGITVVLEEVQEFARSPVSMPPYLSPLIRTGRNSRRNYVAITQRPQEIPKAFFTNAKHRFYFKIDYEAPSDYDWQVHAIGKDMVEKLRAAEDYSFVYKERGPKPARLCPPVRV